MPDTWDDSDDEWDVSDDDLDARLKSKVTTATSKAPVFDDEEEDLALKEKEKAEKAQKALNKTKGNALKKKKEEEENRKIELEVARKAMEMEEKFESNLSLDERRKLAKEREEQEAQKQASDLFGGGMDGGVGTKSTNAGDTVKLTDLKDHLKHAHKVAQCLKVRTCLPNDSLTPSSQSFFSIFIHQETLIRYFKIIISCLFYFSFILLGSW